MTAGFEIVTMVLTGGMSFLSACVYGHNSGKAVSAGGRILAGIAAVFIFVFGLVCLGLLLSAIGRLL
jgi:hypothetical protein